MHATVLPDRRGVVATHPVQMVHSGGKKDMEAKASGPSFFTERSLAAYLAVSDRTVRNWIRRGELPSYKLGASRRIDPADVVTFLEQRREEAA
jgi:excisionase family DNA binding protein